MKSAWIVTLPSGKSGWVPWNSIKLYFTMKDMPTKSSELGEANCKKSVKNKDDLLARYNDIFKGDANAAQCFANANPEKQSARRYEIYCPFKETPDDRENAPIRLM